MLVFDSAALASLRFVTIHDEKTNNWSAFSVIGFGRYGQEANMDGDRYSLLILWSGRWNHVCA